MSTLLATLILALAPAPAKPAPPTDQDADEAALVKRGEDGNWYVFGEEELTGEVMTPEGTLVPWRRPPHFESMITIRPHFLPELLKLALDLR